MFHEIALFAEMRAALSSRGFVVPANDGMFHDGILHNGGMLHDAMGFQLCRGMLHEIALCAEMRALSSRGQGRALMGR